MAQLEPTDLSQPKNDLSSIAEAERKKLFSKNDYKLTNLYSSTNPDALATGDEFGKGTGGDLDIFNQNAGSITDVIERKTEIKVNPYQPNKPYTKPTN
jgi:hypothetical protein